MNYSLYYRIEFVSKIDGVPTALPYISNDFVIRQEGPYIKFDHPKFVVYFGGSNFLKVRVCEPGFVGLCALSNNCIPYPFTPFINPDAICDFDNWYAICDFDGVSLTTALPQ